MGLKAHTQIQKMQLKRRDGIDERKKGAKEMLETPRNNYARLNNSCKGVLPATRALAAGKEQIGLNGRCKTTHYVA